MIDKPKKQFDFQNKFEEYIAIKKEEVKQAACWCEYGWCKSCDLRNHPDIYFYNRI